MQQSHARSEGSREMASEPLKIRDIRIEVVRRELPDTGLDSDLGRFSGSTEQGVLRVLTEDGCKRVDQQIVPLRFDQTRRE